VALGVGEGEGVWIVVGDAWLQAAASNASSNIEERMYFLRRRPGLGEVCGNWGSFRVDFIHVRRFPPRRSSDSLSLVTS